MPRHLVFNTAVNGQNRPHTQQETTGMKPKAQFIKSVTETAKGCDVQMPWARGARRKAFIERRKEQEAPRKSA